MRKLKATATLGTILLILLTLPNGRALAQNKPQSPAQTANAPFELKDGDRVVFLGNSLFENDFQYGYLELALTTRFPDRFVTFRNLGWTGDNVFGDARSTFTNPPTAYEHLMNQLTQAKPTLVFLGYGGVEAQEGEAGLPRFKEGLTKLLDKIDQLGAQTILLSPIPVVAFDSSQNVTQRNAMLERYAAEIAKTAAERGKRFIDLYKPIQELSRKAPILENGVHLNETGYYHLATILEKGLGLAPSGQTVTINVGKNGAEAAAPVRVLDAGKENSTVKFTMDESYLPLPLPEQDPETGTVVSDGRTLKITGLKKGFYTLTADNDEVVTASAKQWAEGVPIRQGASYTQAEQLRQMILKKNELFYFQYRPLNQTYILGFRSYEQGRHVKGLEEQNILIKWLESQIALTRQPQSKVYSLTLLK
ncbi:lysophospholipase L1-like esterase [Larkinella arboricola]|uniref:Lysophospholipase L1-like esterase n=1 Tax=Larkinella arboricola TaxID=643671 RepID=A0A327X1V9_LARAB|nr:GDSL-type esterase/lipase family protein [Larkinella arboricola]RAK00521.1 lysophospholipase L1-like esterase [Larkinella arboricola]